MILRRHNRILVFGLTGRQATFWAGKMIAYGAPIVGGVNPRKPGIQHLGLPVWASAKDASANCEFDTALLFVPTTAALSATVDALEAGAKVVICLTEHVPVRDVMKMVAMANRCHACLIGPNTAGLVTPGETFAGIMPAFNAQVFRPGEVGVVSRSGSLGTLVCLNLVQSGLGISAFCGVGGDPIIGTTSRQALAVMAVDRKTKAIVLCGEIGGSAEEEAAEYAATISKPVVAFVAGRSAPVGKRMGHAGAIVSGRTGTFASKVRALERNGVAVAHLPSAIPDLVADALQIRPQSRSGPET